MRWKWSTFCSLSILVFHPSFFSKLPNHFSNSHGARPCNGHINPWSRFKILVVPQVSQKTRLVHYMNSLLRRTSAGHCLFQPNFTLKSSPLKNTVKLIELVKARPSRHIPSLHKTRCPPRIKYHYLWIELFILCAELLIYFCLKHSHSLLLIQL